MEWWKITRRGMQMGFFSRYKDSNYNFDFHKERTKTLLTKAQDRFNRADKYLCGEGFGDDLTKRLSAKGAIGKAHSILKEAIFNAHEAIKYGHGNQEKRMQIQAVVNAFASISGVEMFVHPSIIEAWDEAMSRWVKEFNQLL